MVNYLWVLELTIADKGEAYMQIENMVAANPCIIAFGYFLTVQIKIPE
jgi:hypothetical protein